jgi:hypothetical protein
MNISMLSYYPPLPVSDILIDSLSCLQFLSCSSTVSYTPIIPARFLVSSVEIANNKLISALRDAIKDKKQVALEHVDAGALKLWRFPFQSTTVSRTARATFLEMMDRHPLCKGCLMCVNLRSDMCSLKPPCS